MEILPYLAALPSNLREFWAGSLLVDVIKFFLLVYTLVLLADIILILYLGNLPKALRQALTGSQLPLISKSKAEKRWEKIFGRLDSGSPSQYKAAILEADAFAAEVLKSMGHKGENMQEQLEKVAEGKLATKEALLLAHQMRNRIIHEADLDVDRKEAETWLDHYRSFLKELDLLS